MRIGAVRYAGAQPWPFPFSLMIGCYAEATSKAITVDGAEIVAARWFSRGEIREILGGRHDEVRLPRPRLRGDAEAAAIEGDILGRLMQPGV